MDRNEIFKKRRFRNSRHELVANIFMTSGYLSCEIQARLEKLNLTHHQFNILKILKVHHPEVLSMSEVKELLYDRNADFTRLADRMVEKGLVERTTDPSNRRRVNITLTSEGMKLCTDAEKSLQDFEEIAGGITLEEASRMIEQLTRIREQKKK